MQNEKSQPAGLVHGKVGATVAGERHRRVDGRVWLLALGAFATGTDAQVISGILPQISADLSVSLDTAGGVVSVYSVTYAVSAPILAALTVHIRRDRAAVLALAVFTIANALCALAPTFTTLIGARILAGLSGGLFIPTAYALAAGLAPPERKGAALSVIAFGITGAIVAGVPLGILVGDGFGWHAAFWLVTGISAIALVGVAMLVPPPHTMPSAATLPERFAPLVHAPTLLALLPTLLCLGLNGGVYTYLGAMLHERGYSTGITLAAFSLFGFGALTGSQLGGRLADRYGPLRPMFVALAASVVVGLLVPRALDALWSIGLVSFALGAAPWPIVLGQQRRLMALAPSHVEVVLALNNSFVYFGIAVGTAVGGWTLAHGFGLDAIATACAAFPVVALVSLLASEGLSRRRGSTER